MRVRAFGLRPILAFDQKKKKKMINYVGIYNSNGKYIHHDLYTLVSFDSADLI